MRTLVVFFSLALIASHKMHAQDTVSHWSAGVLFGADICYRSLQTESSLEYTAGVYDSIEHAVSGKTLGMRVGYTIGTNLQVQSGMQYTSRGYRVDSLFEASIAGMRMKYHCIELPLMVRYSFGNGKVKPIVRAGAALTFLLASKTEYDRIGVNATYALDDATVLNGVGVNVNAALGAAFTLSNSWSADLLINGNQALLPLVDAPLSRRLNSVGLCLEMRHTF